MAERDGIDDLTDEEDFGNVMGPLGFIMGMILAGGLIFFAGEKLRVTKTSDKPDIEFIRPTTKI